MTRVERLEIEIERLMERKDDIACEYREERCTMKEYLEIIDRINEDIALCELEIAKIEESEVE